ncbi:MAG: RAMP superfamily CRISPR-associated protein [Suilimivivens sp.]
MKKVYYEMTLTPQSPLHIGNGEHEESDGDIMLASNGLPIIPGSSLAGVLRSKLTKEEGNQLFGYIQKDVQCESRIIVGDAVPVSGATIDDYHFGVRDGIGLDEWGITVKGAKFDIQIVETDKPFISIIELTYEDEKEEQTFETIWNHILGQLAGEINVGAKTSRGFGRMSISLKKKSFEFPGELKKWLSFRPFEADAFKDVENCQMCCDTRDNTTRLQVAFHVSDGFIVREKTTDVEPLFDNFVPDYVPLMNREKKPVIPGTTWAGVFRHHMKEIVREANIISVDEKQIDRLFGADENTEASSKLRFCETVIEGGKACSFVRNAVERFTASPKTGGVFSSQIWYCGKGILEIEFAKDALRSEEKQLLALCLIDLDQGLLTFGGEAGVGRGCAIITGLSVNQSDRTSLLKNMDVLCLED